MEVVRQFSPSLSESIRVKPIRGRGSGEQGATGTSVFPSRSESSLSESFRVDPSQAFPSHSESTGSVDLGQPGAGSDRDKRVAGEDLRRAHANPNIQTGMDLPTFE